MFMGKKKSLKLAQATATPAAPAGTNLPQPRRVPKADVGATVQDFIDFGGATAVEAHEESPGTWLVTAAA